jgi:2-haloalkanoic acid dehalogenase type II
MECKAVFLDFYGTLVHEDDDIIPIICEQIKANAVTDCLTKEIGSFWWKEFSAKFRESFGASFQTQRSLGISSLSRTISNFKSDCVAEEIIKIQFEHWRRPHLYDDTKPFLQMLSGLPVYILSNIDTADIIEATRHHDIQVNEIITSEDVKSYKPRPELFEEALKRCNLDINEVIHIGDSVLSDVGGAQNLGIKDVWLNRLNKTLPEGITPDYVCKDLNEVSNVVTKLLSSLGMI